MVVRAHDDVRFGHRDCNGFDVDEFRVEGTADGVAQVDLPYVSVLDLCYYAAHLAGGFNFAQVLYELYIFCVCVRVPEYY